MFRRCWRVARSIQRLFGRFRSRQVVKWYDHPAFEDALVFDGNGVVGVDDEWRVA